MNKYKYVNAEVELSRVESSGIENKKTGMNCEQIQICERGSRVK